MKGKKDRPAIAVIIWVRGQFGRHDVSALRWQNVRGLPERAALTLGSDAQAWACVALDSRNPPSSRPGQGDCNSATLAAGSARGRIAPFSRSEASRVVWRLALKPEQFCAPTPRRLAPLSSCHLFCTTHRTPRDIGYPFSSMSIRPQKTLHSNGIGAARDRSRASPGMCAQSATQVSSDVAAPCAGVAAGAPRCDEVAYER